MPDKLSHVVCADDEEDILEIIRLCLELRPEIAVTSRRNGRLALDAVRATRPDLIVLDVMMPEMNGPETIRLLKADPALASIPVVLMTARVQPEEIRDYMLMGAAGVIAKPFDPMTLAATLQDIFHRTRAA